MWAKEAASVKALRTDVEPGTGLPWSSIFMPSERPIYARICLISLTDLPPKFFVLNTSTSVFWISSTMAAVIAFLTVVAAD